MPRPLKDITFVDAFAGCGGLSLGLLQAGLVGRFVIEQDRFAFDTFRANLLTPDAPHKFSWPRWLLKQPISVESVIAQHNDHLLDMRGRVHVLAGGPPCQGFSTAGRRRRDDPRNKLFRSYIKLVEALQPRIVLIENVRGFAIDFLTDEEIDNYSDELCALLSHRYVVHEKLLDLSSFGVPQQRTRYFLIAIDPCYSTADPFVLLDDRMPGFLRKKGLQPPVSSWAAISDLEISRSGTRPSSESPGFSEICGGRRLTQYQKLMAGGTDTTSDLRLARHSEEITARFAEIIKICHEQGRLNTSVSREVREQFGLRKQALRVLDPERPAPTITSMPDDLLHYREPRTLTVRENARLQSFPDWFSFRGKYTTGGQLRRREVPRFTQVANAVPPLVAEAIGQVLIEILTRRPHDASNPTSARGRDKGSMEVSERTA